MRHLVGGAHHWETLNHNKDVGGFYGPVSCRDRLFAGIGMISTELARYDNLVTQNGMRRYRLQV